MVVRPLMRMGVACRRRPPPPFLRVGRGGYRAGWRFLSGCGGGTPAARAGRMFVLCCRVLSGLGGCRSFRFFMVGGGCGRADLGGVSLACPAAVVRLAELPLRKRVVPLRKSVGWGWFFFAVSGGGPAVGRTAAAAPRRPRQKKNHPQPSVAHPHHTSSHTTPVVAAGRVRDKSKRLGQTEKFLRSIHGNYNVT